VCSFHVCLVQVLTKPSIPAAFFLRAGLILAIGLWVSGSAHADSFPVFGIAATGADNQGFSAGGPSLSLSGREFGGSSVALFCSIGTVCGINTGVGADPKAGSVPSFDGQTDLRMAGVLFFIGPEINIFAPASQQITINVPVDVNLSGTGTLSANGRVSSDGTLAVFGILNFTYDAVVTTPEPGRAAPAVGTWRPRRDSPKKTAPLMFPRTAMWPLSTRTPKISCSFLL